MKKLLLLLLFLPCLLFGQYGSELVTDGDMVNWTADDLDDWSETNADAAEEGSSPYGGSSAKITASSIHGGIYQEVAVTAGLAYRLSMAYKEDASADAEFALWDVDNGAFITVPDYVELPESETWAEYETVFVPPAGCESVYISVRCVAGSDVVYFDAVSIKQALGAIYTEIDNKILYLRSSIEVYTTGSGVSNHIDQSGYFKNATQTTDADRPADATYWVDFDAANTEFLTFGDHNDFTFGDGSSDSPFSIVARVILNDATSARILTKAANGVVDPEYIFGTRPTDVFAMYLYDGTTSNQINSNLDATHSDGDTVTFGATYDGSGSQNGIILYVNGSAPAQTKSTLGIYVAMDNGTSELNMGRLEFVSSYGDFQYSDILMTSDVLTPAEMDSLHDYFSTGFYYPINASSITFSAVSQTEETVSWTRGNGDSVLVVAKEGAAPDNPVINTAYDVSAVFGSGDNLGSSSYAVYKGTGTSVTVTGLTAGETYYYEAWEYTQYGECWNYIGPASGNQLTLAADETVQDKKHLYIFDMFDTFD